MHISKQNGKTQSRKFRKKKKENKRKWKKKRKMDKRSDQVYRIMTGSRNSESSNERPHDERIVSSVAPS